MNRTTAGFVGKRKIKMITVKKLTPATRTGKPISSLSGAARAAAERAATPVLAAIAAEGQQNRAAMPAGDPVRIARVARRKQSWQRQQQRTAEPVAAPALKPVPAKPQGPMGSCGACLAPKPLAALVADPAHRVGKVCLPCNTARQPKKAMGAKA
jgi:hypothetical protein